MQQVIVQNERLFSETLKKTVRPGQKEVQQGLSMAYQIGVDEAKAISKSICNAFKFARSKIQSCSSGKKIGACSVEVCAEAEDSLCQQL